MRAPRNPCRTHPEHGLCRPLPGDNEAWYILNSISDRGWSTDLVACASRPFALDGRVFQAAAGQGILNVTIGITGSWELALRNVDGTLVSRSNGLGKGAHRISSGRSAPGIYLMEIRSGADALTRKVIF